MRCEEAPLDERDRVTVLLASEPRLVDIGELAAALQPFQPHLSAIDLRTRCRYAAGIVEDGAPRAHAEALVRGLAARGLAAVIVEEPAAGLGLGPPEPLGTIDLAQDALVVCTRRAGTRASAAGAPPGSAPPTRIPWDRIEAVLPWALLRPFARRDAAEGSASHAAKGVGRLAGILSPRLAVRDGPGAALARRDPRRRADEAAALRANEDSPLGPDAERLQYTLARIETREGREPALGIDLVVREARNGDAAHDGDGDAAVEPPRGGARVLRLERGSFAWPGAHAAHSLEVLVYLGKRLIDATPAAEALPEHALITSGLADTALFIHEEELGRYARWLLAARRHRAGQGGEATA